MMWTSDSWSLSGWAASLVASGLVGVSPGLVGVSLGLAAFLARSAFAMSSGVVEVEKAMRLLSGDHTGFAAPFGRSVTMRASPPARERIAICAGLGLPASSFSPLRMKARRLPSGDQRGWPSCLPLVRRMGESLPEVATVQIEVS